MNDYKRNIDTMVNNRQTAINNEWARLRSLETNIQAEHQRFIEDLNSKRDSFLANHRKQYEQVQRELNDAKKLRDRNIEREAELRNRLNQLRQEHRREVDRLNAEIQRLKRALQDLEKDYLNQRDQIITDGENELEQLRRQIAEYERMIGDNQHRELNQEEIERQCDELFGT